MELQPPKFKEGVKHDMEKLRMDLVSAIAIEELAKVYSYGARKYEDHNWRKGIKWSRVLAALKRHILAFEKGEDIDQESNLLHLAHAMWGCASLLEYYQTHRELDDRYKITQMDICPYCQAIDCPDKNIPHGSFRQLDNIPESCKSGGICGCGGGGNIKMGIEFSKIKICTCACITKKDFIECSCEGCKDNEIHKAFKVLDRVYNPSKYNKQLDLFDKLDLTNIPCFC